MRRSSRRVPPYSSSAATAQQHPARRHRPIAFLTIVGPSARCLAKSLQARHREKDTKLAQKLTQLQPFIADIYIVLL